jgi:hypothetical protein
MNSANFPKERCAVEERFLIDIGRKKINKFRLTKKINNKTYLIKLSIKLQIDHCHQSHEKVMFSELPENLTEIFRFKNTLDKRNTHQQLSRIPLHNLCSKKKRKEN